MAQLNILQFAKLTLGQEQPPWHLNKLLDIYGMKFVSLKSTMANLSSATAILYVTIRSGKTLAENLPNLTTPGANLPWLREIWNDFWFSGTFVAKSDLEELEGILAPAGASIVYLSPAQQALNQVNAFIPAWVIVGIAGTFADLTSLNIQEFPFDPGAWTDDQWNKLRNLQSGIMIVTAGGDSTAVPIVPCGDGGVYMPLQSGVPGPNITSMYLLSGG